MTQDIFFIYDPLEGKGKEVYDKIDFLFDVDLRSRAKFMRSFIFALVEASKK